mmetsp:Transcript_3704/g.5477  ORF Transcript_3704/g.5477 Transcript_3704/m.5477 type:complete len:377 (+) Transcript_3704:110-1240(+)
MVQRKNSPKKSRKCHQPGHGLPQPVRRHDSHQTNLGPNTPGPQYNTDCALKLRQSNNSGSFQRSKRFQQPKAMTSSDVSPLRYNVTRSDFDNKKGNLSFSHHKRFHNPVEIELSSRPGVGGYSPDYSKIWSKNSSGSMSRSRRFSSSTSFTPGPGAYGGDSSSRPSSSPHRSRRSSSSSPRRSRSRSGSRSGSRSRSHSRSPPSRSLSHSMSSSFKSEPSFSFGSSPKLKHKPSFTPSPLNYRPERSFEKVARRSPSAGRFSTRQRFQIDREKSCVPSPLHYSISDKVVSKKSPGTAFGRSARMVSKPSSTPGAGSYSINDSSLSNNRRVSGARMSTSLRDVHKKSKKLTPSPGDYSPNYNFIGKKSPGAVLYLTG